MRFLLDIVVVGYAAPKIPTVGSKRVGVQEIALSS